MRSECATVSNCRTVPTTVSLCAWRVLKLDNLLGTGGRSNTTVRTSGGFVNPRLLVAGCTVFMSVALMSAQPQVEQTAGSATAHNATTQRALIDQYCVGCHNARTKTANLLLDQLDLTKLGEHTDIAEK